MNSTRRCFSLLLLLTLAATAQAGTQCWQVDPVHSALDFTAQQAGGTLDGGFKHVVGRLCLDDATAIRVEVRMASVETGLPELDTALRGEDFFAVDRWPSGEFRGESLERKGDHRYVVTGTLQLRDVTRRIQVPFQWTPPSGTGPASLDASFTIKRLDFGIGQGQWSDTEWVGNPVQIHIHAQLTSMQAGS